MSRPVLLDVYEEMLRQVEIHPTRPSHPFEWNSVLTEEVFEALAEVCRLAQNHTAPGHRLRTELIQVAATCAAWAETLPRKEKE